MSRKRIAAIVAVLVLLGVCIAAFFVIAPLLRDPWAPLYAENCAVCHGENLQGAPPLGPPLLGSALRYGDSVAALETSIARGFGSLMPAWSATLEPGQIQGLAILISERSADYGRTEFQVDTPLVMPEGTLESERHAFRAETVVAGLHPWPFSIAPLPDGRILVTEKTQGLRIVSADGQVLPSIWTYGHRSPQGLEFDRHTGRLWSTEMGPRGGDELNLLRPGRNYGWPLISKGMDYDGTPVEYCQELGIARIRDVEIGPGGVIYLLLEHASGGRIVRLVPGSSS
jgi:hypothetical protein